VSCAEAVLVALRAASRAPPGPRAPPRTRVPAAGAPVASLPAAAAAADGDGGDRGGDGGEACKACEACGAVRTWRPRASALLLAPPLLPLLLVAAASHAWWAGWLLLLRAPLFPRAAWALPLWRDERGGEARGGCLAGLSIAAQQAERWPLSPARPPLARKRTRTLTVVQHTLTPLASRPHTSRLTHARLSRPRTPSHALSRSLKYPLARTPQPRPQAPPSPSAGGEAATRVARLASPVPRRVAHAIVAPRRGAPQAAASLAAVHMGGRPRLGSRCRARLAAPRWRARRIWRTERRRRRWWWCGWRGWCEWRG
jgi:hypothetical protein